MPPGSLPQAFSHDDPAGCGTHRVRVLTPWNRTRSNSPWSANIRAERLPLLALNSSASLRLTNDPTTVEPSTTTNVWLQMIRIAKIRRLPRPARALTRCSPGGSAAPRPCNSICKPLRTWFVADGNSSRSSGDASHMSDNRPVEAGNPVIRWTVRVKILLSRWHREEEGSAAARRTATQPNFHVSPFRLLRPDAFGVLQIRCQRRCHRQVHWRRAAFPPGAKHKKGALCPSQHADKDEIGIDERHFQQNKDEEAENGERPVQSASDSPPLIRFIFCIHTYA